MLLRCSFLLCKIARVEARSRDEVWDILSFKVPMGRWGEAILSPRLPGRDTNAFD